MKFKQLVDVLRFTSLRALYNKAWQSMAFRICQFIIITLCVYNCGYKGPLYMPHNNEASKPVTTVTKEVSKPGALGVNNESTTAVLVGTKSSESMTSKNSIKIKQTESSVNLSNINSRRNLNESN